MLYKTVLLCWIHKKLEFDRFEKLVFRLKERKVKKSVLYFVCAICFYIKFIFINNLEQVKFFDIEICAQCYLCISYNDFELHLRSLNINNVNKGKKRRHW